MRYVENIPYDFIEFLLTFNKNRLIDFYFNSFIIFDNIKKFNNYTSYSNEYYRNILRKPIDYILDFDATKEDETLGELIRQIKSKVNHINNYLNMAPDEKELNNKDYYTEYIDKMKELRKTKNADYGDSFNRSISKFGYTSAFSRVSDKLCRAMNLIETGKAQVEDESIEDSLLDAANYLIMTADDIKKRKDKNEELIWSKKPSDMKS